MPSLKQLICSIELGSTHTKVVEHGKDYGDGHVTSYIAVPSEEVNFSIHLTSHGYIAPGLAMFVYMDGQYQCNRNRRGLQVPAKGVRDEQVEVDLRVRQKESKQADGSFLGRDWTFHGLNLVSADKVDETDDVFLDNLGTIEVIVLRCKDAPLPPPSAPVTRESSSRPASKPASKHSTAQQEKKESSKPSSSDHKHKTSSAKAKQPPNMPSKPATTKESSAGDMMGNLFDGASDEPDHAGINPKSYWNDWNKRPTIPSSRPTRNLYLAPEEPLPLVPKQVARSKHVEHQVKTGKGAQYLHLCARPEYLDSMKQPYAVFTFKYRSKRFIEKKFKIEIKEEGKALKAKLADMSKDELAEELFRLRMTKESSSFKHSKEKTPSAAKEAQVEVPATSKTPSVTKSKTSKTTTAPIPWDTVPTPTWEEPATQDTKPASNTPSKVAAKVASKTASQKEKQAPGAYPASASSRHTASNATAAAAASSHPTTVKSGSKSGSKKSNREDAAAGAEDPAAATGDWNQTQPNNAAWETAPAAAGGWDGGAGGGVAPGSWGLLRITFVIIGFAVAVAILVFAYFWIKSYLLKAMAFFLVFKAWVLAPFARINEIWLSITDLGWTIAPFAWAWSHIKGGLLWVQERVQNVKIGRPKFLETEMWSMEWLKRPEWLSWPAWRLGVPEIVKDGFEVFVPDAVQVEQVLEEL
ncbi:hypothetical protein M436DRAFT_84526 [Aureobasidium namibiae CBS 147.97]|uniref:DUF7918 domain-containing protein n=1 Tax=Aureobasidium namibiae CBS 147.97 TaxID=1043004 RepID=A0A074X743_9PEZI